jgi:adenylate cyclase
MIFSRPRLNGTLTGLAVAVICTVFFVSTETGRKLELLTFDWRVRHAGTIPATSPIVHVDIDDGSLERIGRWPWRRSQLAQLIGAIADLGAGRMAIDLQLSEYESPLILDPRYGPHSDVEPRVDMLGEVSEENVVFGDLELASAVRDAGNVYLTAALQVSPPGHLGTVADRLQRIWKKHAPLDPSEAAAVLGIQPTKERLAEISREIMRLRVQDQLLGQFKLTAEEIAGRLRCDPAEVSAVLAGAKKTLAKERVAGLIRSSPPPTLDAVLTAFLGEDKDRNNADRVDVLAAYAHSRGVEAVREKTWAAEPGTLGGVHYATEGDPPHFYLAEAARGIGAVNFSPDIDGAVRQVPLLIAWQDRIVPHLGFALACDALGLDISRVELRPDHVLVVPRRDGGPSCMVPLDARGSLVIPWTNTAKDWRRGLDYPHIPAAKIWSLAEKQEEINRNQTSIDYLFADVVAVAKGELKVAEAATDAASAEALPADQRFRLRVNEQVKLAREARLARLRGDRPEAEIVEMEQRAAALLAEIREAQKLAVATVESACREFDALSPEELAADASLAADAAGYRRARDIVRNGIGGLQAANARLKTEARQLQDELTPWVKDKYVFLGYAATATGDIVTTPIDPRTNGVMCHAQVLSGFLQNRFIRPPVDWLGPFLCIALGMAACLVTAFRGPKLALVLVVAMMAVYALFNAYVVFGRWGAWTLLAGPLGTAAVTWAAVTLFRQLTAERERRFFAKQLGQYTSPAIAARIAESPEAAQAFKTVQARDVTCFFSDLKGFTSITEREDAAVIQLVLNTYLERMSRAIWSSRGLINKFMGDGIMAFFNASVDPVAEHQRAACEASLSALDELERLRAERRSGPGGRVFEQLAMRIGLASGRCLNGDMGSELKADYTVIGDVVNLAARLEPANKVFGTRLMVAGPTREAVGDLYEFRYLAELQVKGKAQTVPVYELVCRRGELTEDQADYHRRFEAGVELYKQRKWDECIVHFTRMLSRKFDDPGASRYIDACQEFKVFPPGDDWTGALELKEK